MIRVLIAEDEPLARQRLRDLLDLVPWAVCAGEVADGHAALRAIADVAPDLVLLDIRMPGLSGLELLEQAEIQPAVIFTTAFDQYAVAAFELGAIDYLLKPFGEERFHAAMDRARHTLADADAVRPGERAREMLAAERPLTRLFVRHRSRIVPIPTTAIQRLEAHGDYVALHLDRQRHLAYLPLAEFERRLDPQRFLRVHRSHIVNLDFVAAFTWYDGARLQIEMKDGTRILASRTRSRELRRLVL